MKKCVCKECRNPRYKLGFCQYHYQVWLAAGIPVSDRANLSFEEMMDKVKGWV